MRNEYDIAVVIGRFQPVHSGHLPALEKARNIATKTVCVIGSANRPPDIKNPFSSKERIKMIQDALNDGFGEHDISFIEVEDTFYLESEWYRRVRDQIKPIEDQILKEKDNKFYKRELGELYLQIRKQGLDCADQHKLDTFISNHGRYNKTSKLIREYKNSLEEISTVKIAVLGHDKDPSSYYLNSFSNWDFVDIGSWVGDSRHDKPISATDIRDLWFSGKLSYAKSNLHPKTYEYMLNYDETKFLNLKEEWEYIKQYKEQTQVGPFPVQFLTTDAVVINGDQILLVKRGMPPGKGLWALPGGFKQNNETFFEACIRELKEETEIDVPVKVLKGSKREEKMFDYPKRSLRGTTVTMAYSFVLDPIHGTPKVRGKDDAVLAWWFPISDVLKMKDQIMEDHMDIIDFMIARL